jgi:hypothetical protein
MWRFVFWGLVLVVTTGCSFNRDWKRAAASRTPTNDIAGAWVGHWRSDVNNHNGKLWCILTPHAPNAYMARYKARFWKIFTAKYSVPLSVTNMNGDFRFSGTANLGTLGGGIYTYEGSATPTNFQSRYRSKRDHGTFTMTRPKRKK